MNDTQLEPLADAATQESAETASAANAMKLGIDAMVVDSAEQYEFAATQLHAIKGAAKAMREKRLGLTRPIDALKKNVMELFKPTETVLAS